MTTQHHVARAAGSTGSATPRYQVELRAGQHELVADEPTVVGGGDAGPSPFGLVMSGLAACTATTLRMYAERHDWTLASVVVDVRYNVDDDKKGTIERTITLPADLSADRVEALTSIAERTPVTVAVRAGTPITTTIALIDAF